MVCQMHDARDMADPQGRWITFRQQQGGCAQSPEKRLAPSPTWMSCATPRRLGVLQRWTAPACLEQARIHVLAVQSEWCNEEESIPRGAMLVAAADWPSIPREGVAKRAAAECLLGHPRGESGVCVHRLDAYYRHGSQRTRYRKCDVGVSGCRSWGQPGPEA